MDLAAELKEKLIDMGASIVGFSNVGESLKGNLTKTGYAVTVGVRLSDYIIDEIKDKPTYTYFHHYRTVNALIDQITLRGLLLLQDRGYNAITVPASQTVNDAEDDYSAIFPHKTAAVSAGLGWIGRNGLFISSQYGPRLRLGTILADYPLTEENQIIDSGCGDCNACVKNCPAMALTGNCWEKGCERSRIVDAKACSEYMNKHFKHIGRGSVCGICMRVCPKGIKR